MASRPSKLVGVISGRRVGRCAGCVSSWRDGCETQRRSGKFPSSDLPRRAVADQTMRTTPITIPFTNRAFRTVATL
jgi:hypothetical protein